MHYQINRATTKFRTLNRTITNENQEISNSLGMLIGQAYELKQIIQKLYVLLTGVSLLQLGTAKLFAYAEVTKSEFNKISEIFPIFIYLTRFSRFAFVIEN